MRIRKVHLHRVAGKLYKIIYVKCFEEYLAYERERERTTKLLLSAYAFYVPGTLLCTFSCIFLFDAHNTKQ